MNSFTTRIKHLFVISTLGILMLGCSKSERKVDCHAGFNLDQEVGREVTEFSNAAIDYFQDPTPTKCNKYKNALSAYINALEKFEKCAIQYGDSGDWRELIREAREDVKDLDCH